MASIDGFTPIVPICRSLLSMPSIMWLFWLSWAPLTEMADVLRRSSGLVPLASEFGRPAFAPGTVCTSSTKFRPLTGRSCTS